MSSISVEEFINNEKSKILTEKSRLNGKFMSSEKNEIEKQGHIRENKSDEKENALPNDPNIGKMLKFGEFSPNNPKMRVATQPYIGLGEYEQRKQFLNKQRKTEYKHYMNQVRQESDRDYLMKNHFKPSRSVSNRDQAVQTDIQNIQTELIQRNLPSQTEKNDIIPDRSKYLYKGNNTRAKLMADLQSSYFPTFANYVPDDDRIEKARRQEKYFAELRQQIEEKQQLLQKHKEQEKLEHELNTRRINRISIDDRPVLATKYNSPKMILKSTNTNSPPLSRKKPSNKSTPPYSFNIPANSAFANNTRNTNTVALATNKHITNTVALATNKPSKMLKMPSPVAKDLIRSQPVTSSSNTSDQMKNLEAKWQIPATQKNVENKKDGILTQIGAIRLQLQQEQLRLDETLKTRGLVQTTPDVYHPY